MAGRSADKLAEVRDLIGAPASTPLVVCDAADPAQLSAMVRRARVIVTTVGPYQLYGSDLVAACGRTRRLVLRAPTGSGKSTRIPQMLLDLGLVEGQIVVLQPRRIAARLLAAVFPRQTNCVAFAVVKPPPGSGSPPWIRWSDGRPELDPEWARVHYRVENRR
jgi:hypothetical protein